MCIRPLEVACCPCVAAPPALCPSEGRLSRADHAPAGRRMSRFGQAIVLFLKRLFRAPRFESEGRALYHELVVQARLPVFYTGYGVPDTIDGRFEMLCLHAYALFHSLKGKGAD